MEVILDHKDIKKSIVKSQHVQRNWDLSREMPQDDIDLLVHAATHGPSKQNFKFYNLHVVTNRDIIEKVHSMTEGLRNLEGEMSTNSQTLANLLIIFEDIDTTDEHRAKWELRDNSKEWVARRDADMAIGVAAGYINVLATMLGYGTGCCACFDGKEVAKELGFKNEVRLMMGIGFADKTKNRRIHHETGKMMGRRVKEPISVIYHR